MRGLLRAVAIAGLLLASTGCGASSAEPAAELALEIASSPSSELIEQWLSAPPALETELERIQETVRGQTLYVAFLTRGHALDPEGQVHLTVSYAVKAPDGSTVLADPEYALYRGTPPPGGRVMLVPALDLMFEDADPVGVWRIEATLEDHVAKRHATSAHTLKLSE